MLYLQENPPFQYLLYLVSVPLNSALYGGPEKVPDRRSFLPHRGRSKWKQLAHTHSLCHG